MWIVRQKNGRLNLCNYKPCKDEYGNWVGNGELIFDIYDEYLLDMVWLRDDLFPEVTYEKGPVELKLDIQ